MTCSADTQIAASRGARRGPSSAAELICLLQRVDDIAWPAWHLIDWRTYNACGYVGGIDVGAITSRSEATLQLEVVKKQPHNPLRTARNRRRAF